MTPLTEIAEGVRRARPTLSGTRHVISGMIAAGLALPVLALAGPPVYGPPLECVAAGVVAIGIAAIAWRWSSRSQPGLIVAAVLAIAACFLAAYVSYPGSGFVLAGLIGAGVGPLLPREPGQWLARAFGFAVAAGALTVVRAFDDINATGLVLALLVAVALIVALRMNQPSPHAGWNIGLSTFSFVYGLFAVFWIGSTSPRVTWFGQLTWHGNRSTNEVALTFDDGPNGQYTLAVANILEQYGARGTFFMVGKAVVQEPALVRQLIAEGHVVGNHSYYHGAFSYLDPAYPELKQTNHALRAAAGVCPAFFRPPHGTHTPFMSRVVNDAGMTLVTWDDSTDDWAEHDPQKVARTILAHVRPGSIIDLHDGSDGNIGVDTSVVARALPIILQGLKARGLHPVTLDKLLGKPAYLKSC